VPEVTFAVFESPYGPIHAAATAAGVTALSLRTTTDAFVVGLGRLGAGPTVPIESTRDDHPGRRRLLALAEDLAAYWDGTPLPEVGLDLRVRSAWDRHVLAAVRTIGYGETLSYGGVAARAGTPRAARAAGGSVGRNPIAILIPCHRVIAGDGSIGGYGGSWFGDREELLRLKRSLLAREGVAIPT
jgi:methylated-DNA-[protein]-cysteine S-methyltransferase